MQPPSTPTNPGVNVREVYITDMNLEPYPEKDGMMVWLSSSEVDRVLDVVDDDTTRRVAMQLGVRSGLRSHEVVDVSPQDVVDTDAGHMVRVWEGKGDKYRETPIPATVASTIDAVGDVRDAPVSEPVVDVTTRQVRRWVSDLGDELAHETDDDGWHYLGFHDLRRTWATSLLGSAEVDPVVVMDWGGWSNIETMLQHYRGTYAPEVQRRERDKVDWL